MKGVVMVACVVLMILGILGAFSYIGVKTVDDSRTVEIVGRLASVHYEPRGFLNSGSTVVYFADGRVCSFSGQSTGIAFQTDANVRITFRKGSKSIVSVEGIV